MRKVAVVTGTRAEYGLLYWIIKGINEDPEMDLQLIVTGMHLSSEFGLTVQVIEDDGFPIAERAEILLASDTETAIAASMGIGLMSSAKAYERLKPDILVVLGDRFEIFSAVAAAVPFRLPIAHIHGGESTEGAFDEQLRHAITKMSHIHFPATQEYAHRIMQMGEAPENIFCYGAPGLDNVNKLNLLDRQQLSTELGLPLDKPWGVITYHPVTLERDSGSAQIKELLEALGNFPEIYWVFTLPNADMESRSIIESIERYVQSNSDNTRLFSSLGQLRYLSLLRQAAVMVGNSSSGIIEAPSFELPVVNIGSRQQGRIRAKNVIDASSCERNSIAGSISQAISKDFQNSLKGLNNPYGDGTASARIVEIIKTVPLSGLLKKRFYES